MMRRKVQLTDLMIVVASAASALTWYRLGTKDASPFEPRYLFVLEWVIRKCLGYAILTMLFGSLALTLIWIRPPRPRWRKLVAQPGFAACLLASLWVLVQITLFTLSEGLVELLPVLGWPSERLHVSYWPSRWFRQSFPAFANTGLLVLAGWSFLRAAGLWRAQPTWADRLGRLLGTGWILVWVCKKLLFLPYLDLMP